MHTTTKRNPKDIRDIEDEFEINKIKEEIIRTLERKNKNIDVIDTAKYYVLDSYNLVISKNNIIKGQKKKKEKKPKKVIKIPVSILMEADEDDHYWIEIKKSVNLFKDGEFYVIKIDLLEEVSSELWHNLL